MKKYKLYILLIFIITVFKLNASEYEFWENKFQTILSCNSKSGSAISGVKITNIQQVPQSDFLKIDGTYIQAIPIAVNLGRFGTNNFAESSGVFQAFIQDDSVLKARYKISILQGNVKSSCLQSSPSEFDF